MKNVTFILMTAAALTACSGTQKNNMNTIKEDTNFNYVVDQFADIQVLRYKVPGFESLSLQQKELLYHLSEAALMGRDILFDQNCRYNLPIRRTLEAIYKEYKGDRKDAQFVALETYLKKGYDPDWVHQRLLSIRIRNELTDEWQKRGVEKGREFAILTDEITRTWSGMTTRQYKNLKGLKKENLRDNMSDTELVLTMLAEASTRDISKASKPEGFSGSMEVARQGGEVAGVARKALEERTGAPVITAQNAAQMNTLVVGMIEEAAALPAQAEADDKE